MQEALRQAEVGEALRQEALKQARAAAAPAAAAVGQLSRRLSAPRGRAAFLDEESDGEESDEEEVLDPSAMRRRMMQG